MNHNHKIGLKGEQLAVCYLKDHHFEILEQNWRFDHKEIDIIARDQNTLVVVEVKTRTNRFFHNPIEDVSLKKQAFLIQATEEYLYQNHLELDVRFDIMIIFLDNGKPNLEHIQDAFHPIG